MLIGEPDREQAMWRGGADGSAAARIMFLSNKAGIPAFCFAVGDGRGRMGLLANSFMVEEGSIIWIMRN